MKSQRDKVIEEDASGQDGRMVIGPRLGLGGVSGWGGLWEPLIHGPT